MFRELTGHSFIKWVVISICLLLFSTILFKWFLWVAIMLTTGGKCGGGICGALGVVFGIYGKILLLFIFVLITVYAVFRRLRMVGSQIWLLFVLALILPSAAPLFAIGNFWGANFSLGILYMRSPSFLLVNMFAFLILLCISMEEKPAFSGSINSVKWQGKIPVGFLYVLSCFLLAIYAVLQIFLQAVLSMKLRAGTLGKEMTWQPVYELLQSISKYLSYGWSIQMGESFASTKFLPYLYVVNLGLLILLVFALNSKTVSSQKKIAA